jgi:hypothetical protein
MGLTLSRHVPYKCRLPVSEEDCGKEPAQFRNRAVSTGTASVTLNK